MNGTGGESRTPRTMYERAIGRATADSMPQASRPSRPGSSQGSRSCSASSAKRSPRPFSTPDLGAGAAKVAGSIAFGIGIVP